MSKLTGEQYNEIRGRFARDGVMPTKEEMTDLFDAAYEGLNRSDYNRERADEKKDATTVVLVAAQLIGRTGNLSSPENMRKLFDDSANAADVLIEFLHSRRRKR